MKKIFLLAIIFFYFTINVNALELNSKYVVLYNLNNHEVLYNLNKDKKTSIASLTKIMTTLVAIENIKNYDETVIIDENMFSGLKEAGAYMIGLKDGQKLTYNDLLYAMFLASAADATRAIAISIIGSERDFVLLMNQKAKEIGLKHTHFANTVGLDDKKHYSTVDDVAIMLEKALENDKFQEIFKANKYTFADKSFEVSNGFRLTSTNANFNTNHIIGGKTGYTGKANHCLASVAYDSKNDITYLLVTTNADNIRKPIIDAINVYEYYFQNYKFYNLVNKMDLLVSIPVKYSKTKKIDFYANKEVSKYLKNTDYDKNNIKLKYEGIKKITPYMSKNKKLGVVKVIYQDKIIDNINITLENKPKFSLIVFIITNRFIFLISSIILLVILTIFIRKRIKYDSFL